MLTALRHPLLPTLAITFLYASPASAACAWVLWKQAVSLAPAAAYGIDPMQRLYLSWSPEGAYENQAACEQIRTAKKEGKWTCLPDTVDPRGPKAK